METFLILLPFLAALAVVFFVTLRRIRCPDCGDPLPFFYSPFKKTRRMWRVGGYLCARCGCETDTAGRKVTADTPLPPIPVRQWVLLGVLLLIGLGLGMAVRSIADRAVAEPPAIAAPQPALPVVVHPDQAPPLVLAD